MKIGVLGINHKSADVQLREKLAKACLKKFGFENSCHCLFSYVLLTTCNRCEIYFHAHDLASAHSCLLAQLRGEIDEEFEHRVYSYFGEDCFAHLAKVTAGMDSALVGETEIQGQVKQAYEMSAQFRPLSSEIHFLFQKCLKIGKEIRTYFSQSCSFSLGDAILQAAKNQFDLKKAKVLFIGLSEINLKVYSRFRQKGIQKITFCNRTREKVERMQEKEEIYLLDWQDLDKWHSFDITVIATKSRDPILTEKLGSNNVSQKKLIADLGVPRNVDPKIVIPSIALFNVDQLNALMQQKRSEDEEVTNKIERCMIGEKVKKQINIFQAKERHREDPFLCVS